MLEASKGTKIAPSIPGVELRMLQGKPTPSPPPAPTCSPGLRVLPPPSEADSHGTVFFFGPHISHANRGTLRLHHTPRGSSVLSLPPEPQINHMCRGPFALPGDIHRFPEIGCRHSRLEVAFCPLSSSWRRCVQDSASGEYRPLPW
jgi:hypothetical protein